MNLLYDCRSLPEDTEGAPLPAYMSWPAGTDSFRQEVLSIPQEWRFRYAEGFRSGEQYFAMLQIVDTQQNVRCSRPVLV